MAEDAPDGPGVLRDVRVALPGGTFTGTVALHAPVALLTVTGETGALLRRLDAEGARRDGVPVAVRVVVRGRDTGSTRAAAVRAVLQAVRAPKTAYLSVTGAEVETLRAVLG
jgi:Cu/Ag efflux pump CusA